MSSDSSGSSSYRAVIGGWLCLIIGTVMKFWHFYASLVYGSLFLASFILGIVAIVKRHLFNGLMLICLSYLIPSFLNYVGPAILANCTQSHTAVENNTTYPSDPESTGRSDTLRKTDPKAINDYQLSIKERNVLMNMIYEDVLRQINGRKHAQVITLSLPITVSSENLMSDYEQNEVRADQEYKDKKFIVKGTVNSINRGFGENYYLTLSSHNLFMGPRANMDDGYESFLAGLEKGDTVNLFCQGSGMLLGSPILDKCVPVETLAAEKTEQLSDSIIRKFTNKDENATLIVASAIALSSMLPETSACLKYYRSENINCISEVTSMNLNVNDNEDFKEALKSVASKFNIKTKN